MRNTWIIIQREYLERVRTRAFLISTILVPLFMFAAVVLPTKLMMMKTNKPLRVVVATSSAEFGDALRGRLKETDDRDEQLARFDISVDLNTSAAEREALRQRVSTHDVDGFVWATDDAIAARKVAYTGRDTSDFVAIGALRRAITSASQQRVLLARGLSSDDVQQLLKPIELETVQVRAGGKETKLEGPAAFIFPVLMVLFLYTTLIMYGMAVLRAVIEEKSSRIVEVLLASVSPTALMAGKILGVGAVGATQAIIWAVVGGVVSTPGIIAARSAFDVHVAPAVMVSFPLFFVLGYLLYSASFAAIGAAVNSEQEAQQFQVFAMLPIILSIMMMNLVIRQPSSGAAIFFSMFPFTSPILMYLRIVVQQPPLWEIGTAVAILAATTAGMMFLCARIYRVGVLMYGKRPTLPEIMKWLKYA